MTASDYGQLNAVTLDRSAEQIHRAEQFLGLAVQSIDTV
jgi:hypothetical protein